VLLVLRIVSLSGYHLAHPDRSMVANLKEALMRAHLTILFLLLSACSTTVRPGHLGIYFDGFHGTLQRQPVGPGVHYVGLTGRIEDFDVTYATRAEDIRTTSAEALQLDLKIAVIFRPVRSEIYELDTEIGTNYYDKVIAPAFRSATRGVFARYSYLDAMKRNEQVEDEVLRDLRRRIAGTHLEIALVTLEAVKYDDEIVTAVRARLAAEQDAARQKVLLDSEATRRKIEAAEQAEHERLKAEASQREKLQEIEVAQKQVELDRLREEAEATSRVMRAKADAEADKYIDQEVARQARPRGRTFREVIAEPQSDARW
jgi:regulator of protease activity HflC (stomatin/prohibitin superfamily)